MAAGRVPNVGLIEATSRVIKDAISGVLPWTLLLWVNDYDPDATTVIGDLTEASFAGYSQITLDRAEWTTPVVDVDTVVSTWKTVPQLWQCTDTSDQTIYGYAFVDLLSGVVEFVQRLEDVDITEMTLGRVFTLLPRYRTKSPIV